MTHEYASNRNLGGPAFNNRGNRIGTKMTAYWVRNKTGNTALGTLYSGLSDQLLKLNISLSEAKLAFPRATIYEDKGGPNEQQVEAQSA